ncbi:hypothetical protein V8G54_029780 [Vigna mungo]|uniref:Uncharacterized protein n=1 Tax=Vigna mungo TaxID=3915 RepID=A0AAQ3MU07_VIGMU
MVTKLQVTTIFKHPSPPEAKASHPYRLGFFSCSSLGVRENCSRLSTSYPRRRRLHRNRLLLTVGRTASCGVGYSPFLLLFACKVVHERHRPPRIVSQSATNRRVKVLLSLFALGGNAIAPPPQAFHKNKKVDLRVKLLTA